MSLHRFRDVVAGLRHAPRPRSLVLFALFSFTSCLLLAFLFQGPAQAQQPAPPSETQKTATDTATVKGQADELKQEGDVTNPLSAWIPRPFEDAGIVLAVLMLIQQHRILTRHKRKLEWPDHVRFYRRQMRWTILLSATFFIATAPLLLSEGFNDGESFPLKYYRIFLLPS